MLVTRRANLLDHCRVHFRRQVVVWLASHAAFDLIGERGAFVHVEQVQRKMFWPQLQGLIEISQPASPRLPGQPGDQIEVDVVETCVAKLLERFGDVARSVRATEHLQFAIVESLRAETGAIDSEAAQVAKEIASSAAVTGIDLQRQLRIFRNLKSIADSRQNSFDLIDRQKRRRAAAEVNRVDERG